MDNSKQKEDRIFEGPIGSISVRLAIPVVISNLLILLYNIVDTLFISMIDKSSTALMSGIGLIFPLYFLFMAISMGLFTGVSSFVARSIGENKSKLLGKTFNSALLIVLIVAFITLSTGYIFPDNIVNILAGSKLSREAINYGLQYFYYLLPGLIILLFSQLLSGIFQGEGHPKYLAFSMLISTVLNIILDPVLIFVFKMGVAGAALGTSISLAISLIFLLVLFLKKNLKTTANFNIFQAEMGIIKEILKVGITQMLVMMSLCFGIMFLNNIISSISEVTMNAWTIVGRIDQIVLMPGTAFGNAALTLIGQNYGRNNLERVQQVYKVNIGLGIVSCILITVLYNLLAYPLFSIFTSVPEVLKACVTQVRILSFTYIGVICVTVTISSFQAVGKPFRGLLLIILRVFVLLLPLVSLLVVKLDKGIYGVFAAIGSVNIVLLFVSFTWGILHFKELKFNSISN